MKFGARVRGERGRDHDGPPEEDTILNRISVALAAGLLLVAGIGAAAAAGPAGTYQGTMTGHDGRPVAATLQVDGAAAAGAKAGQLRFGEPRQCSLTLVLARKAEGQSDFSLPTANGGWCDRLRGGSASVRLTGKDGVAVVLTAPRGGELGRLIMQARR